MIQCLWYISKYAAPPLNSDLKNRSIHLLEEFSKLDLKTILITSDSNNLVELRKLKNIYSMREENGFQLIQIRTLKYKTAKSLLRVLSWFDFELKLLFLPKKNIKKPDVIIVSSLSLLTILNGIILKYKYKAKLIFEIRDIWPLTLTEEGNFSKYNPLIIFLGIIEKIGYKKSDLIVGTMPNLASHVENVLGYSKKTICIPMGYSENVKQSNLDIPNKFIKQYFSQNKFIVAYSGTIGITNALDVLFECANIMQDNKGIQFLIIGDGALKAKYESKYSTLTNLTFVPKIQKNMVQSALSYCDILFFSVYDSNVWKYGQSLNKIIDYMISGKPIIASYNGFQSMINEAKCGSFIPANDAIILKKEIIKYSLLPKQELERIGGNGKKWILQNRSYNKLASDYLKAINSI